MEREVRVKEAQALLDEGDVHFQAGRLVEARDLYYRAHDLVIDVPRAHRAAHARMLPVHVALGMTRDIRADRFLLAFAPLGVFHLIALPARIYPPLVKRLGRSGGSGPATR
ncbi:MAG: hypothetical protein KC466_13720 [Myxococcales bacterium]|nr:hypothetical protein [Myxococcales bacterium]